MNRSNAARSSPLVVGPPVVVHRHHVVAEGHGAEQVLQSVLGVGEAFHVEEHVAVGGRREQREAAARLVRVLGPRLPERLRVSVGVALEPGLDAEPFEHWAADRPLLGDAADPRPSQLGRAQVERGDAGFLEPADLAAGDVRDPAQVVGALEQLLRLLLPAAPAAVEPGLGRTGAIPARPERRRRCDGAGGSSRRSGGCE